MTEEELFLAVLGLPDTSSRATYLEETCGADDGLRRQVEARLAAHFRSGELPSSSAADVSEAASSTENTLTLRGDSVFSANNADDELDELQFLAPSTRPDSLGRIGHYEVLEVLGKGGFGIVLRALDDVLKRVVAVKVMAAQLAATSPPRKRFLREARTSAQVRHENVVQVYEVGEQPLPYLVMEFIPGETLQQRLDRTGPLDVTEVLWIGRQIAEGLAAAHATELIHRDIKPANVLIEGGQHKIKITDFGLARAADDASISQSGLIAGTPMYMAPEQALGQKLDQRVDLFSLGSVLYQMVTGRPPFRANSTVAVLKRVAEDTPRDIPEIVPETPQWLCDIIAKLHAKNPDERYQSAREVADVLADCEAQLKAHSELKDFSGIPGPTLPSARSSKQRKRAAVTATLLLPLIALATTEFAGVTHLIFRRQETPDVINPEVKAVLAVAQSNPVGMAKWGQVVDPLGDCRVTEADGRLTMTVPGDRRHDLNPKPDKDLNAPRVLQAVAGDFEALLSDVRFIPPPPSADGNPEKSYAGGGLLLWQDEGQTFLRLFRVNSIIAYESWSGGEIVNEAYIDGFAGGPLQLRIRRAGDTLHLAWSLDGQQWSELATTTDLKLSSQIKVGVAVVNLTDQEFTTTFEGFSVTTKAAPYQNKTAR